MPKKSVHKSSWKAAQSSSKTKKQIKLATSVLAILILVLLVGKAVQIAQSFFKPLSGPERQYVWGGGSTINLVFINNQISLFSFDPNEKTVKIANFHPDTYIEAEDDFGSWQIRSIPELPGKAASGNELLTKSLANFLGVSVNGYLNFEGSLADKKASEITNDLKNNPLLLVGNEDVRTNLTPAELFMLVKGLRGVRFDKVSEFDLEQMNLLEDLKLQDGSDAKTIEPAKVDGFISENFSDSRIVKEQISIAVYNATSVPGVALKAARIITNMGGNVIITTNAEERERSAVSGENNYTKERLIQIFAPNCLKGEDCDILEDTTLNSRAQINVVLGKDFLR